MTAARLLRSTVLLGALLAAIATSGCGTISALTKIQDALEDDGFTSVSFNLDVENGVDTARVSATSHRTLEGQEAVDRAAEIVWREFERRVEVIEADVGPDADLYTRPELEARFGPRPAGFDDEEVGDDVRRWGIGALIAVAAGGLLCVGLVILVVVLIVRSSRRKRPPTPPFPPGYGPPQQPGYQQPGYQPQGYGQQGSQPGYGAPPPPGYGQPPSAPGPPPPPAG